MAISGESTVEVGVTTGMVEEAGELITKPPKEGKQRKQLTNDMATER